MSSLTNILLVTVPQLAFDTDNRYYCLWAPANCCASSLSVLYKAVLWLNDMDELVPRGMRRKWEFCNITKMSSPMCLLYQNTKGYLLKGKIKKTKAWCCYHSCHGWLAVFCNLHWKITDAPSFLFFFIMSLPVQISVQFPLVILG